jgi:hypothetical protein
MKKTKTHAPVWWEVLQVCRALGSRAGGDFTAPEVANRLNLPYDLTTGYVSKLVLWGYLSRGGSARSGKKREDGAARWNRLYRLTDKGRTRGAPKMPACPECGHTAPLRDFFK